MSLQRYLQNRWIREHASSRGEIEDLLAIADRDIVQSQTKGLGPEWRFAIAYNAALQLATAALAAAGYHGERQNKHMRVLECLEHTVGLGSRDMAFLDHSRRKRHTNVYDQVGAVSETEADEMVGFSIRLRARVVEWLKREHPDLMS
jgi:hypothetical protein